MRARVGWIAAVLVALMGALIATGALLAGRGDGGTPVGLETLAAPVPRAAAATASGVVDARGRATIAWPERSAGRWTLRVSARSPGRPWSAPETVVSGSRFPLVPGPVASNARGDVALLWRALGDRGHAALHAAVRSADGTWTSAQAVSRAAWMPQADIAIDDTGTALVAGTNLAGPGLWATERAPDGDWTPLRRLAPAGFAVDSPAMTAAGDRAAVVALLTRPGYPRALWAVTRDGGRWGSPEPLPASQYAHRARIVLGPQPGQAFAAWSTEEPGILPRVMVAVRAGGEWRPPTLLDAVQVTGTAGPVLTPGAGGAHLAWTRWEGDPAGRRVAVRVSEVDAGGAATVPRTAAVLDAPAFAPDSGVTPGALPPPGLVASVSTPQVLALQEHGARGISAPVLVSAPDGSWGRVLVPHPGATAVALAAGVTSGGEPVLLWGEARGMRPLGRILVSEGRR